MESNSSWGCSKWFRVRLEFFSSALKISCSHIDLLKNIFMMVILNILSKDTSQSTNTRTFGNCSVRFANSKPKVSRSCKKKKQEPNLFSVFLSFKILTWFPVATPFWNPPKKIKSRDCEEKTAIYKVFFKFCNSNADFQIWFG